MDSRNKAVAMIQNESRLDVKIALIEMWLLFETNVLERQVLVEKQDEFRRTISPPEVDEDILKAISLSLQSVPSPDEEFALSLARAEEYEAEEGVHLYPLAGGGSSNRSDEFRRTISPPEVDEDILKAISLSLKTVPSPDEEFALSLARVEEHEAEEGVHLYPLAGGGSSNRSDEVLALSLAHSEECVANQQDRWLKGSTGGENVDWPEDLPFAISPKESDHDQYLFETLSIFDKKFTDRHKNKEQLDAARRNAAELRAQLNVALPGKQRAKLSEKLAAKK
jgi:hypothetical protein